MTRVALRSVRTHIGQFLLTVLAVVLGVTFLSGTLALRGVLSDTFSALTSSTMTADLYVTGQPIRSAQSSGGGGVLTEKIDGALAERIAGQGFAEAFASANDGPGLDRLLTALRVAYPDGRQQAFIELCLRKLAIPSLGELGGAEPDRTGTAPTRAVDRAGTD